MIPRKRGTILLVEDDPSAQVGISEALTASGFTVVSAVDAPAAMSIVRLIKPHLILLDLVLRVGHGREVLRVLDQQGTATSVIVMTAEAKARWPTSPLIRKVLTKPFEMDALLEAVEETIGAS